MDQSKIILYDSSYAWNIKKLKDYYITKKKQIHTYRECKLVVTSGKEARRCKMEKGN